MSSLPTRRATTASAVHPRNSSQPHQVNIPPSGHTSSPRPAPSRSLLSHVFSARQSRRTRLLVLVALGYLGWLYYAPSAPYSSSSWRTLFSLHPASQSGTTPVVSRDVLGRLAKLEDSLLSDDERAERQQDALDEPAASRDALPLVDALPGTPRPAVGGDAAAMRAQRGCPEGVQEPCRFVLAGLVGEQETKAQLHIHQLGLLALRLNRTLVLPQVSESRMGSCLGYPFEVYYAPDALSTLGVPTISHADFQAWAAKLPISPPSARLVALVERRQLPPTASSEVVSFKTTHPHHALPFKPERGFCLVGSASTSAPHKLRLDFQRFVPLTVAAPDRWQQSAGSRDSLASTVLSALRKAEGADGGPDGPDVLVFNYELRHALLDPTVMSLPAFTHFAYAPVWVELAETIVGQLPPLVGVHWRQETVPVARLAGCMRALVSTLEGLKRSYPSLETVYLSTDYPLEGLLRPAQDGAQAVAHSGTFSKHVGPEHHAVMGALIAQKLPLAWATFEGVLEQLTVPARLVAQLSPLPNMVALKRAQSLIPGRLQTAAREQETLREVLRALDRGLVGILEKMILIRANVFLTGVPDECSKASSFTRQIVDSRQKILDERGGMDGDHSAFITMSVKERKENMLNLVEYWTTVK